METWDTFQNEPRGTPVFPLTSEELEAAGWQRLAKNEKCRTCGRHVWWLLSPDRVPHPLVEVPRPVTAPEGRYWDSHFNLCSRARRQSGRQHRVRRPGHSDKVVPFPSGNLKL